jgi:hypothetical protein
MPSLSQRLLPVLQLTRMALVFTAVADSLASFLIRARAIAGPHASIAPYLDPIRIIAVIVISVGLYGFGMSLNDIIDRRRDSQLAAHRPLPSGKIGVRTAYWICASLISAALIAGAFYTSGPLGDPMSFFWLVWTGTLIAFYDFAGKYLVWPGLITLGLIRFFHATIAAPNLPLLWQPLLLLNHVCLLSAVAYWWEEKRPPLTRLHWWSVLGGLAFLDSLVIAVVYDRRHERFEGPTALAQSLWITPALLLPLAAALVFILIALGIRRSSPTSREAGQKLMLAGLLWLIVYDAAFVAGYVNLLAAAAILLLLPLAYFSVRMMRWWSNVLSLSHRPEFKRAG